MQKFKLRVFQARQPEFAFNTKQALPIWCAGGYDMVAVVTCHAESISDALERAYVLTSTIDRPWWQNDNVQLMFDAEGCRSTSVGDVIWVTQIDDRNELHQFMVDSVGFKPWSDVVKEFAQREAA